MVTKFADWLEKYRADKGWSIRRFAMAIDIAPTTLVSLSRGAQPSAETITKISRATQIPEERLLEIAGYITKPHGGKTDPGMAVLLAELEKLPPRRRDWFYSVAVNLLRETQALLPDVSERQSSRSEGAGEGR